MDLHPAYLHACLPLPAAAARHAEPDAVSHLMALAAHPRGGFFSLSPHRHSPARRGLRPLPVALRSPPSAPLLLPITACRFDICSPSARCSQQGVFYFGQLPRPPHPRELRTRCCTAIHELCCRHALRLRGSSACRIALMVHEEEAVTGRIAQIARSAPCLLVPP